MTTGIKAYLGGGKDRRSFTYASTNYFTVPEGVTEVYVTGGGGGGGGSASYNASNPTAGQGKAGTPTSFGNLLTLPGGSGASNASTQPAQPGGFGGQPGQAINFGGLSSSSPYQGGKGGDSGPYSGGMGGMFTGDGGAGMFCAGGGGAAGSGSNPTVAGGGGGGADFVYDRRVTVTPGERYTITIGAGGQGGSGNGFGGKGGNGILIIEWWE